MVHVHDHVVAGGPEDFAEARHVRVGGTNAEIGRVLGQIASERHGAIPARLPPVAVRARRHWYELNYPIHHQRMAGVRDAFGVEVGDDHLDFGGLGHPSMGGCSVVYYPNAYTEEGCAYLSRNYESWTITLAELLHRRPGPDGLPMCSRPYIVECYPDQGYPSLYITYSYALIGGCFDGVNAEGLMVSMMSVQDGRGTTDDPTHAWAAGLAEMEVLRLVLDTCATADQAQEVLLRTKQYYYAMPCHYILGDRTGRSFVFEFSESHNAEHIIDGGGEPHVVTNHLLHRPPPDGSIPPRADPTRSRWRRDHLQGWLADRPGPVTSSEMKRANARVACNPMHFIPTDPSEPRTARTMYHALYNADACSVEVSFYLGDDPSGGERRSPYLRFALDPPY